MQKRENGHLFSKQYIRAILLDPIVDFRCNSKTRKKKLLSPEKKIHRGKVISIHVLRLRGMVHKMDSFPWRFPIWWILAPASCLKCCKNSSFFIFFCLFLNVVSSHDNVSAKTPLLCLLVFHILKKNKKQGSFMLWGSTVQMCLFLFSSWQTSLAVQGSCLKLCTNAVTVL